MTKEYGELSTTFYELTKPVGYSIDGDIEYYSEKLANVSGRVLEAGVGTGRMLIPLIKQSVKVDGVDLSPQMLKQCRVNLKKHQVEAMLFEQDLIHLSLPHKYDAIIMPAGSFCLLQKKMVAKVLKNFYNHLNPGGKIIIDLEMPIFLQAKTTTVQNLPVTEDVEIVLTCHSEKIEWLAQKTSCINKYELKEKEKVQKSETSNFVLYWYGIEEFAMLLELLGYKCVSHEIGYGHQQSDMITYIAQA